jgi:RimJ/RimL family protein N-acetyltransferase
VTPSGAKPGAREEISFRRLTRADLPMLVEWLARPHVAEWWGTPSTAEDVEREYGPIVDGTGPHHAYVAYEGGEAIGFSQSYVPALCHDEGWWLEEHDPGVRGIDQFLADQHRLGRGLGTAMVRAFVAWLFSDPAVTRVQTDPEPGNPRAIRCYEKAGFRAVREIVTVDGPALLMYQDRPPVTH